MWLKPFSGQRQPDNFDEVEKIFGSRNVDHNITNHSPSNILTKIFFHFQGFVKIIKDLDNFKRNLYDFWFWKYHRGEYDLPHL